MVLIQFCFIQRFADQWTVVDDQDVGLVFSFTDRLFRVLIVAVWDQPRPNEPHVEYADDGNRNADGCQFEHAHRRLLIAGETSLTTRLVDVLISVTELVKMDAKATGSRKREGLSPILPA